jgi:hypothetical protein
MSLQTRTISIQEDNRFGADFLEKICDWLNENLEPDKVFPIDNLKDWIKKNYSPEDVFPAKELQAWAESQNIADVFSDSALENWAERAGWSRP